MKIGINNNFFFLGIEGNILFSSKKFSVFFLLKFTSNLTLYSLLTKLSSFIVKESISLFIVSKGMLEILFLSPEVVIIEINSENANLNPLSITSSLLKLSSNGSSISIFDILNVLAFKVEKKIHL